jgi:NADH-quinone oxidoreductase subunit E
MLSDEERKGIEEELAHYPTRRAACVEALKIVQQHRGGWIDDSAIKEIAEFLQMTPDELDSIATCYNLIFRREVGRHVILLCDSVSCWVMGYDRIRQKLKERLGLDFGGTTSDGRFTLLPIVCLGLCDHAPAMMVDEDTYGDVSPENLGPILDGKP